MKLRFCYKRHIGSSLLLFCYKVWRFFVFDSWEEKGKTLLKVEFDWFDEWMNKLINKRWNGKHGTMINKPATIPLKQILKIGNPLLSLVNIILLGLVLLFSYILKKIYNMIKSCGNKGYAKITLIIFNIFFSICTK
jgi:hypothetical protein